MQVEPEERNCLLFMLGMRVILGDRRGEEVARRDDSTFLIFKLQWLIVFE